MALYLIICIGTAINAGIRYLFYFKGVQLTIEIALVKAHEIKVIICIIGCATNHPHSQLQNLWLPIRSMQPINAYVEISNGNCQISSKYCCFAAVKAQDPTVKIKQTDPDSQPNRVIIAQRDRDVTMDCYVENLLDNALVRDVFLISMHITRVQLVVVKNKSKSFHLVL